MKMASPDFSAVNSEELTEVIDVCTRCFADKSEKRIDLIPGGKQSSRMRSASPSLTLFCLLYHISL
jgi:hypothetical protein